MGQQCKIFRNWWELDVRKEDMEREGKMTLWNVELSSIIIEGRERTFKFYGYKQDLSIKKKGEDKERNKE